MLGDHAAHGDAHQIGLGNAQGVHGQGDVAGHVAGGIALGKVVAAAEHVYGVVPGVGAVHGGHRQGFALDGGDAVAQARQHDQRLFAAPEADIVHVVIADAKDAVVCRHKQTCLSYA